MAREEDKQLIVDRNFFVPPGVIDVRQDNELDGSEFYGDGDAAEAPPALEYTGGYLPTPSSQITIVSQTVRITDDGQSVTDVVVEIPGIDEFQFQVDLRVTKE